MADKFCENCGKRLGKTTKGTLCFTCTNKARKERAGEKRRIQVESREKRLAELENSGIVFARDEYPGKERCAKCGHGVRIDCTVDVACCYIDDADKYKLPPRPRPSADPQQCLYFSRKPSEAGTFTEEQKRKLYNSKGKNVLDIPNCKVYLCAAAAAEASGEAAETILKDCRKNVGINSKRRWRYLTPQELVLIEPERR